MQLQSSVITGLFTVLGSSVTGLITYLTATRQRESEKNKRRLEIAYQDIAALYRLEERYTAALETASRSAMAWKREIRKQLRDEGFDSPSDEATALKAERSLAELKSNK